MPVRKIVTRSFRGAGGDGMSKSAEQKLRHLRVQDERQRRRVLLRLERVERVLRAERDHDFVDERLTEARDLHVALAVLLASVPRGW